MLASSSASGWHQEGLLFQENLASPFGKNHFSTSTRQGVFVQGCQVGLLVAVREAKTPNNKTLWSHADMFSNARNSMSYGGTASKFCMFHTGKGSQPRLWNIQNLSAASVDIPAILTLHENILPGA